MVEAWDDPESAGPIKPERITVAHVRQVGPKTFEARDPSAHFSAVGGSEKEAVALLRDAIPLDRRVGTLRVFLLKP
ncbi:MAG: hypothetical protein IT406_02845 [Candidatus Yanofskybacteria bacterium]|nr:hypothetical protein [Candidatus Yanofskybacteria bacterium]